MKSRWICAMLLLPILFFYSTAYASLFATTDSSATHPAKTKVQTSTPQRYVPGELLVKYKNNFSSSAIHSLHANLTIADIQHFKQINVRHIKLPAEMTVAAAIKDFKNNPAVEYAEPNYIYSVCATPSDAYFSSLWGLQNIGQEVNGATGAPRADINAPSAWDITVGNSAIIVALIDTGVDYNHPDLAANISKVRYNFIDDNNDPMDGHGHGTHVAGIIAATGNNNAGVTGVAWSATLMPLRVGNTLGILNSAAIIAAINYARTNGANIINASFGGPDFSQSVYDAIATAGNAGILFVAAAGNDAGNNDSSPFYPASYKLGNIISVAATNQNDDLGYFSNYGASSVDVGAPGINIYSTNTSRIDSSASNGSSVIYSGTATDNYQFMSGTSMSTAYVSGLAALIWGYNSALTNSQVKDIILRSVDLKSSLSGKTLSGGRINAFKALNFCVIPAAPSELSALSESTSRITLSWTNNVYATSYILERKEETNGNYSVVATIDGKLTSYNDSGLTTSAAYSYRVKAVNYGGESGYSNEADATTTSGGGGGGDGSSSGCFIATAAFGSPLAYHVKILRDFRDNYLLHNSAGKAFVAWYYRTSPPVAKVISENEGLRLAVRGCLLPIIGVTYLIMTWGAVPTLLGFAFLIIGLIFLIFRQGKKTNLTKQIAAGY